MALSTNGSTVTFSGTSVGELRSIDFSDAANEIDVTVLNDTTHVFETGIPSLECTVEVLGTASIARGDTGALSISWNDGGSDSIGTALVTAVEASGSLDSEITTSITFMPSDS